MALVKYGGGIIQMSGSIAGNTYARNRYGNYVRAKTKPVNPSTHLQQQARSALAELVERWYTILTGAQRTAWNLYADSVPMKNKLGETIKLAGFNHYIRSNTIRVRTSRTVVDAGPVIFTLPDHDPNFSITASEGTQQLTTAFDNTAAWAVETGGALFIFQGRPQNPTRNFFKGPWKGVTAVDGIDPGGAVTPDVAASWWGIAEGQRIWSYARISRADGRLSEPFHDDVIVAA